MAYTRGRCTNIDYCPLAASRRDIEVKVGEPFMCPECARPLMAPQPREAASGGAGLLLVGAAVVLVLIVGGVYAGYRLSSGPGAAAQVSAAFSPPEALRPAPSRLASAAVSDPPLPVAAPKPAPATAPASGPSLALPMAAQAAAPPPPAAPLPLPAANSVLATAPAPLPAGYQRPAPAATAEPATLLRLNGSGAWGATLAPRLAAAYLESLGHVGVAVQPRQAAGQILVSGTRLSRPESITITLQDDASGLVALDKGAADVAMTARRITRSEMDRLRTLGDLSTPASEHPVALQGLAVIVHPRNTLAQISMTQLRGVLDGSIATWQALGGSGHAIHVLTETASPGMSDLVAGAPDVPPGTQRVADASAATAADPDALAVVPAARVGQNKVLAVVVVGASPALPTPEAIAGDTYPLARRLYLYASANTANPFVSRFVAFAISPEGQGVVRKAGLVPLGGANPAPPGPQTAKDRYKQLVAGAARLAADLHFEPGSNKLDLHSEREVDRVWNVMLSNHTPANHLILVGFADNIGPPEANTYIAKQRAQAVADVFARRGLQPGQVVSFGPDLPIADNATAEGREKNRRVEVFLKP